MQEYMVRFAMPDDHPELVVFYKTYYKPGHPLFNFSFWKWQYGNAETGRSIIAVKADGEIIGHMGCTMGGGLVWLINILINKTYSGHGLTTAFFVLARSLGPIAVALANAAGQSLLAKKKWFRYADLQRYVLINPGMEDIPDPDCVQPITIVECPIQKPAGHYWLQPGMEGIILDDGTTASIQKEVGGLRVMDMMDASAAAGQAWKMGFLWMDFIASWNHPMNDSLQKTGWKTDTQIPWYLNPVDYTKKIVLNLFSEEPLPKDFLFHRSYADIGRIGRI